MALPHTITPPPSRQPALPAAPAEWRTPVLHRGAAPAQRELPLRPPR